MMAGIAVRAGTSLPDREDSSLPPVGRTARTPRRASPSLLHDSALCTAPTTHAKTPIPSSSDQDILNSSSSLSTPTGTKLAVTTTCDSPAGGEDDLKPDLDLLDSDSWDGDLITYTDTSHLKTTSANKSLSDPLEIEKEIALSQLQELEVAIKVRKVSKVDGRKVRWIEYRARKAEEEKSSTGGKSKRKSRRSGNIENDENALNINNNNNNNNSDDTDSMKGEVISTPLVLESMKLQFLQGTENIEGAVANGNGDMGVLGKSPDAIQKRKSNRTRKNQSTPKENKEVKSSPKSTARGTPKGKTKGSSVVVDGPEDKSGGGGNLKKLSSRDSSVNGSNEILTKIENVSTEDIPTITAPTVISPVKVSTPASSPNIDDQPLSSLRNHFKSVTKGLREVRKTENGTDGETNKSENGILTSVNSSDNKLENDVKCIPATPLGLLLLTPSPRAKSDDSIAAGKRRSITPKRTKLSTSKSIERVNSESESIINGHQELQNGSPKEKNILSDNSQVLNTEISSSQEKLVTSKEDNDDAQSRRLRGRPSKRRLSLIDSDERKVSPLGKSSKKVETVVADVHNSMNGEPQTVIPVSRPLLRGKKVSPTKKTPKGSPKVASPSVEPSNVISLKSSDKKSTSSGSIVKGKDKSAARQDAKKKVPVPKKKANAALQQQENVETIVTSSASVSNQSQATPKSKSTKPAKGVTSDQPSPAIPVEEVPSSLSKANPHSDSGISVSDSELKKGKQTGKPEKSLAGRVIRRVEAGKSPDGSQGSKRSPLPKGHLSLKDSSATKGSPTGKGSSVQKSSNIQRSISVEKVVITAKTDKKSDEPEVQKVKSKPIKASEGLSPRKSSVSLDSSISLSPSVEEIGKKGHKHVLSLSSVGRSKTSPGILVTASKVKQGMNASDSGKGKSKTAKSKEGSLSLPKEVGDGIDYDEDFVTPNTVIPPTFKKGQKRGASVERSKAGPKKSVESKVPASVTSESQSVEELDVSSVDGVNKAVIVCDDVAVGNTTEPPSAKRDQLDKEKQVSAKQKKLQKESGTVAATKKGKKDLDNKLKVGVSETKESVITELTDKQVEEQERPEEIVEIKVEKDSPRKGKKADDSEVDVSGAKAVEKEKLDICKGQKNGMQTAENCVVVGDAESLDETPAIEADANVGDGKKNYNFGSDRVQAVDEELKERDSTNDEVVTKSKKQPNSDVQKKSQISDDLHDSKELQEIDLKQKEVRGSKAAVSPEKFKKPSNAHKLQPRTVKEIISIEEEEKIPSKEAEPKDKIHSNVDVTLCYDKQDQTIQLSSEKLVEQESVKDDVKDLKVSKDKDVVQTVYEASSEIQNVEKVGVNAVSSLGQDTDNGVQSAGPKGGDSLVSGGQQMTSVNESDIVVEIDRNFSDAEKEMESRSNNNDVCDVIKKKNTSELSTNIFYTKAKSKKSLLSYDGDQKNSDFVSDSGIEKATGKDDVDGDESKANTDALVVSASGSSDLERNSEESVTDLGSEAQGSLAGKSKDKVPRILKQLFQDEGVQNMLKSMNDESVTVPEGSPSDSTTHKLRPKRPTEPMLASSPELDGVVDALFSTTKKRKRWSELDTLYMDEGVLNLLTSIDPHSRRAGQDDAASDISQASSIRSVKTNKSSKSSTDITSESRKRKLSGASTVSNTSTKSMQPPESKKICLEQVSDVQDPYDYNAAAEDTRSPVMSEERSGGKTKEILTPVPKKKGRPALPLSVKQKNKAIRMQLKIQKQKQMKVMSSDLVSLSNEDDNINLAELQEELRKNSAERDEEENVNLAELQDVLRKEKEASRSPVGVPQTSEEQSETSEEQSDKSIPTLKIKLASDSVTISHIPKPDAKKHSMPVIEITKTPPQPQPHPHIQSKPQPQPKPQLQPQRQPGVHLHPQQRQLSSGSGDGGAGSSARLPDEREPATASTSTTKVYPVAQHGRVPLTSAGFPSLVRTYEFSGQGRGRPRMGETLRQSQRASVRQIEANQHYRDIVLRKFNNFTQIILSPSTTKMKNALNSRVLRELCEALNFLKRDETVRMVLLTATGPTFCQGVDLTALQHPNLETRKKNAENLVRGIKEFLKTLVQFPKPIVAGVNGNAMGLGVTMLPLFDLVIASDKAEFYLPYAKLGQIPEGGATYTFPNLFGKLKSTQLFLGHKVTATMALEMGLASESLWPATYQQELIPKVALLATQSAQSMEATKALMNHHLITKLELSLESECRILLQHWMTPHFAHLCKRFLDSHHIHLQKPVNLPL